MLPSLLASSLSAVKAVLVDFLVGFLANRLVILVPLGIVYPKLYSSTGGLQMKTIDWYLNIYSHAQYVLYALGGFEFWEIQFGET